MDLSDPLYFFSNYTIKMTKITLPQLMLGLISCYLLSSQVEVLAVGEATTTASKDIPHTASIILLGRKGSGITSTVRQILGPRTTIHAAEVAVASTDILEYTLRTPSSPGKKDYNYLKIVDVPGLELGDNLEHDAEILSTLKSYLHDKGLPTFFLVVSRFDDKHFTEVNSQFRQLLKRVEFLQKALFQTSTDNTLFLFTRLLNEPEAVQQSPNARISEFRRIIEESTALPKPVEILVGDNKPDNSTILIENGFFKLPNNELYPKNVLDKLVEVASRSVHVEHDDGTEVIAEVVKSLTENRETAQYHTRELVAHPTDEDIFESDLEAFEFLLRQDNLDLPSNEIQSVLQSTYERQDASTQISSCLQLLALRVSLRNLKLVERIEQLPQTLTEQVRFFQKDADGVMTSKYSLYYLKHALALEVPEYPSQNVVGLGYDVINDRLLLKTPFLRNPTKRPSSSLGYQFPDFVECEKLVAAEESVLANSTESLEVSHLERLEYLTFADKDKVVTSQLKGDPKSYFNYKPSESRKLVAVKEVRVLECKMTVENDSISIVDESFTSAVNSLPHLNTSNPETFAEWNLLLHSYGTHVVTKTYGGGCYQGSVSWKEGDALASQDSIDNALNDIVSFKDLESQSTNKGRSQFYQFYMGDTHDTDDRTNQIHHLSPSEKTKLLEDWKSQLHVQFEMLTNEMELVPISQLIKVISPDKGKDAEAATRLLYQGKLVVENTAKPTDQVELREKARDQAWKLKTAYSEKILDRIDEINKFLDETS